MAFIIALPTSKASFHLFYYILNKIDGKIIERSIWDQLTELEPKQPNRFLYHSFSALKCHSFYLFIYSFIYSFIYLFIYLFIYFFGTPCALFSCIFCQAKIGNRRGLSRIDARQMNLLYRAQCRCVLRINFLVTHISFVIAMLQSKWILTIWSVHVKKHN